MAEIFDYQDALPHKFSEVICLKCYDRWIAVRPDQTRLVDLECENCGPGFVIETGEIIDYDGNYTMKMGI